MSQIDRIKEELGWLKIVFAALIAVEVSLIAWLAQNFETASAGVVWLASLGVVVASVVVIWVNRVVYRRLKSLENL